MSLPRPRSRAASIGSVCPGGLSQKLRINLKDCEELIRRRIVDLPGGFSRCGNPLIILPDSHLFFEILESDLHMVLKYFIQVIPMAKQSPGFAVLIDRRNETWQEAQSVFEKIVTIFPAKIKEVFLVYQYTSEAPMLGLGHFVDDYLLDFDIYHVSHVTELVLYIDVKYLSRDLGGTGYLDLETWFYVQYSVDSFTDRCTKLARRLANFIKIIQQEDISLLDNYDCMREVAHKNRSFYRQLRTDLHDLSTDGLYLQQSLLNEGANAMQKLSVEIICQQLDNTWQYFTTTFKVQDRLYLQYVELNAFQNEFRELSNKFKENEKIIQKLQIHGTTLIEINEELDNLETVTKALSVDVYKAKKLAKTGETLMLEHSFTKMWLEPFCMELKNMCKKQKFMFLEKRSYLLKFLDLFDGLEEVSIWCDEVNSHLDKKLEAQTEKDVDILDQIKQLDKLIAKQREMIIRSRSQFEDEFYCVKDLINEKCLLMVDQRLNVFHEVKSSVLEVRKKLRDKAAADPNLKHNFEKPGQGGKHKQVVTELVRTECEYISDLECILTGYKERMTSKHSSMAQKAELIFGNMEQLLLFHKQVLLKDMEKSHDNPSTIATIFIENSEEILRIYCRYCQNMETAQHVLKGLGENHSLIQSCQRDLGHQLPLSSYLLKPVQRLTKYQLILKQLSECSPGGLSGKFELEESLEVMLGVIKLVNDSLHQPNIKGLPEELFPLGSLVYQETFLVLTIKIQSQIFSRNTKQKRQVLIYDNYLVFCKTVTQKTRTNYHFKMCLSLASLGMSSIIKEDVRIMEIWIDGHPEKYRLEAKNKKLKEEFAAELKKGILKAKENPSTSRTARQPQSVQDENITSNSDSEPKKDKRPTFNRSKSLDHEVQRKLDRQQSSDTDGGVKSRTVEFNISQPLRSSSETHLTEKNYDRYLVLADYDPLSERELGLRQMDEVDLLKTGCAGWWFVQLVRPPYSQGWAPSTYLQQVDEWEK